MTGFAMQHGKLTHIEVRIPLLVRSPNVSMWAHWSQNMSRVKKERRAVALVLSHYSRIELPVTVTMTRLGMRELDSDNIVGAFKHVRDEIAVWLGCDDRDERVTWNVSQEKATRATRGTRIRIERNT